MAADLYSIRDRVALITGGSRGIGQAIAELFAERGAQVIVCSRRQESVDEVAAAIRARGGRAHAFAAHVGKLEEIERLLGRIEEQGLEPDILVNNAGISPPVTGEFCDTTPALWDKIMDVNLRGPFFLTAAVARKMAKRGSGTIVNISTTSARMAQPEIGAYCVSKAALDAMTRVFARELGPKGIRVNGISCGVIRTVMGEHTLSDPQRYADFVRISPIKRPGLPEEVAAAALFLASGASSYTTGETMQVDGGVLS